MLIRPRFATDTEVLTGVNLSKAVNPSGLTAKLNGGLPVGLSATAFARLGNVTAVGSYTSCTFPTANKDYINKTGIGTGTSVVGELVQVTGGTGATAGFYRIVALISANSIQVDRNIHAEVADITNGACSIYKDVVCVFATDGTYGQLIASFSAQNKPLQIGGTVLVATGHSLTSEDILVGGDLEVDGVLYPDGGILIDDYAYFDISNGLDGAAPPEVATVLSSTNKVVVRNFDPASDEDLLFDWDVPGDFYGTTITFRVITFITNATGPSNEGVAFFLQGASIGDGDILSSALGTAIKSSWTGKTEVQYDRIATAWSAAVTITDILANETTLLKLYRDISDGDDTYAQDVGASRLQIKFKRLLK